MRSISLYVDKDTYLTRMHLFTKLCYILTAIAASLIAFSFTILLTIFLIHGLFNHENANLMFQLGPLKFYREGMMYAFRISCFH